MHGVLMLTFIVGDSAMLSGRTEQLQGSRASTRNQNDLLQATTGKQQRAVASEADLRRGDKQGWVLEALIKLALGRFGTGGVRCTTHTTLARPPNK
ncbi:hypothetical protein BGZ63DRAFT_101720 [Mariannaea sp. PMI_226]|nr:hypothetical protein BGZ63DRAFT_101720 [Mariannaea sp. PMI_226]